MLCTEDRCKAALLEALLFSKINNAVTLHTEAEWVGTDEGKRSGGYLCLCTHSLLWLSCAQCQLFAAFRIFCLLEVKSHMALLTAHRKDIHWQGYPGWCRTALPRPSFPWRDFCPGRRQGGHKDAEGNLEGGLNFMGSKLIRAVLTKYIFNGQSNCMVYGQKDCWKCYVQFLSPSEISWSSCIASVCFLSQTLEKV